VSERILRARETASGSISIDVIGIVETYSRGGNSTSVFGDAGEVCVRGFLEAEASEVGAEETK